MVAFVCEGPPDYSDLAECASRVNAIFIALATLVLAWTVAMCFLVVRSGQSGARLTCLLGGGTGVAIALVLVFTRYGDGTGVAVIPGWAWSIAFALAARRHVRRAATASPAEVGGRKFAADLALFAAIVAPILLAFAALPFLK